MEIPALPPTGTCEVSTLGRRSGATRRVELWYIVVDGQIVLTGTPGRRHWLANLRRHPTATLHLRRPPVDVRVTAAEVTRETDRRGVVERAWLLQPWYAQQPYSVEDWVRSAPMVILTPADGPHDRAADNAPS